MWLTVGEAAFPGGALRWQDSGVTQAMALQESCLGQMALGVWGHLQGLSSVPQMQACLGQRKHTPVCCLGSTASMWTKTYKLKKKKVFPRASSEYGIFLCGEERRWR